MFTRGEKVKLLTSNHICKGVTFSETVLHTHLSLLILYNDTTRIAYFIVNRMIGISSHHLLENKDTYK
jgi:hypothetical protein